MTGFKNSHSWCSSDRSRTNNSKGTTLFLNELWLWDAHREADLKDSEGCREGCISTTYAGARPFKALNTYSTDCALHLQSLHLQFCKCKDCKCGAHWQKQFLCFGLISNFAVAFWTNCKRVSDHCLSILKPQNLQEFYKKLGCVHSWCSLM